MNFSTAVKTCFNKYIDFSGRAARSEFWWYTLFIVVGGIVTSAIDGMLGMAMAVNGLFSLATLLPSISVTARRLHDTDRSGWWMLLMFIPLIGWLILLYFEVQKGTDGENRFGPNPLG